MNCKDCNKEVEGRSYCSTCYSRKWRKENKEKYRLGQDKWYKQNKKEVIEKVKKYKKENPNIVQKCRNNADKEDIKKYYRDRYNNDSDYRLKVILRNRLRQSIKFHEKSGSAVSDLGCSIDELKKHLESKFTEGMSWDNYGKWHIDHIKPLASFDLSDREQFLRACHYSNLQPLWAKDNLIKKDRI